MPEDYGSIADVATEVIDCGSIPVKKDNNLEEDEEEKPLPNSFSYCSTGKTSSFKIKGSSSNNFNRTFIEIDLNEDSIVYFGIILTWIGFGTLFEIDNGLERIVSPYLSSGEMR
jgi:hypothetical protein